MNKRLILLLAAILLSGTLGCVTASHMHVQDTPQRATEVEFRVMKELESFRDRIRKNVRVCVGSFYDKTGQHKDAVTIRYSKAVTQGGDDILYHMLYTALGPKRVVERNADNFARVGTEYKHSYAAGKPHTGMIQHGGPTGGVVGADYMVTGAVVYYHADQYSGGGGVNIDGIGAHVEKAMSRVGIELRLVDMGSSEILWSTLVESWVSGVIVGVDMFRFITAWGDDYLVQAEAGIAQYLPADHAFQICMATAVVDMIKENEDLFLVKRSAGKADKAKATGSSPTDKASKKSADTSAKPSNQKGARESVPFWKQPSYRNPEPGS